MHTYPKLKGRRISPVEAIEFTARDGLVIRGYLTTPLDPDGERARGLPLLVIAHEGLRVSFLITVTPPTPATTSSGSYLPRAAMQYCR